MKRLYAGRTEIQHTALFIQIVIIRLSWKKKKKKHPIFKDDSPLVYSIVTVQPKN